MINKMSSSLGYSKEFFNDTTVPYDKSKYYGLSWDVKKYQYPKRKNKRRFERVNINYWNLYRKREDVFGPGFPRPIVFVNEDFDENVIDEETRKYKYYTYYLIRVKENSVEENFLQKVKSMKNRMLSIPPDNFGNGVAHMYYQLIDMYESMRS